MSYHCERWTRNIDDFVDGDSIDGLYATFQCKSFWEQAIATVTRESEVISTDTGDSTTAECTDHDDHASWDADYDLADEIEENTSYIVCRTCDTVYHYDDDYEEHYATHDDPHPYIPTREPIVTMHSAW